MAGVRDNTVTNVVSGGIASFKSVGEVPLKSLKVGFNPIQEGDGDPSPSNIRAISGWTGLNVFHTGKNLFNLNWLLTPTGTITDGVLRDPMYRLYNAFALTVDPIPNTKYMDRITISVTAKTTQDYTTQGRGFTIKAKYDDGTNANLVYFSNATSEYTTLTGTSAVNKKVISLHVDYGGEQVETRRLRRSHAPHPFDEDRYPPTVADRERRAGQDVPVLRIQERLDHDIRISHADI